MSAKKKVLAVDDEKLIVMAIRHNLHLAGYDVLEAYDGREAIQAIEAERPDLVILDVMMPELNGFQVCRKIKADRELAGTKVVLLTAKATDADRFWGAEVGADLYLTKPIDPAEVVRRIQELALG